MDEPKTTVMETWANDIVSKIAPEAQGIDRLRIMIALLQARATECRHISGELTLKTNNPIGVAIANQLTERSKAIEDFGMKLAERGLAAPEEIDRRIVLS